MTLSPSPCARSQRVHRSCTLAMLLGAAGCASPTTGLELGVAQQAVVSEISSYQYSTFRNAARSIAARHADTASVDTNADSILSPRPPVEFVFRVVPEWPSNWASRMVAGDPFWDSLTGDPTSWWRSVDPASAPTRRIVLFLHNRSSKTQAVNYQLSYSFIPSISPTDPNYTGFPEFCQTYSGGSHAGAQDSEQSLSPVYLPPYGYRVVRLQPAHLCSVFNGSVTTNEVCTLGSPKTETTYGVRAYQEPCESVTYRCVNYAWRQESTLKGWLTSGLRCVAPRPVCRNGESWRTSLDRCNDRVRFCQSNGQWGPSSIYNSCRGGGDPIDEPYCGPNPC